MSDILKEIVQKIDERQGDDIEVLDFRNTSPYGLHTVEEG